ncbi:MAG: hypothetical protein P4L85_15200 [Paludisphaera borealis]|uniref:hypothetical protein n=1 Tax=Paludisphaera borealis TaxID=1387353 RepID=UPI00284D8713|nr:hypothetical protein [Paludisphaera borealis]MDR3620697.1 hypothetical protein [Paludisphaera borealis]
MATTFALTLILALPGQVLPAPPFQDDPAVRLAYMKGSVAPYHIHRTTGESPAFRLRAEPVFRLDNPVSGVKDSVIFLWTDAETGRPEATIQMYRAPTGFWNHDWTSLSTSPIVAEVGGREKWRPKPGVEFHLVPDAPAPAATPSARLRQLRTLAEEFTATDDFLNAGWSQLRLLPKPWLRYGKAGSGVEDGALFAFAIGTDPEVVLMIESRPDPAGTFKWHYALAPMTSFEVKAFWKGNEVWTLPWRKMSKDTTDPFYDMEYSLEPQ